MIKDLKNLAQSESAISQSIQSLRSAGFSDSAATAKRAEMSQIAISREVSEISQGISEIKRIESDLRTSQNADDEKLAKAIRQVRILKSEASDVALSLKSKQDSISSEVNSVKRREDRVENVVRELNDRVRALERAMDYLPGARVAESSIAHSEISLRSESGESSHRSESSRRESSDRSESSEASRRSESGESSEHSKISIASSESSKPGKKLHWVKKWVKKRRGPESSEEVSEEVSSEETEESSEESSNQESLNNAISKVKSFFNKVLAKKHKFM